MNKQRGDFVGWFYRQSEQQPKHSPLLNPKLLKEMFWLFTALGRPSRMDVWSQLTLANAHSPFSESQIFGPCSLCIYVIGVMFYLINKAYFQFRRQQINERHRDKRWPTLRHAACQWKKIEAALKVSVRPEYSVQRSQRFLKAEDKYSQGARVMRNATATFVFKGVAKQARDQ